MKWELQGLNEHSLSLVGINGAIQQVFSYGGEKTIDQDRTSPIHSTLPISFGTELHLCLEVTEKSVVETENEETLHDVARKKN